MPLLIQLTGSAIALAAFIATQAGWITATSAPYLALNIIGSAALVTSATAGGQWGFVILESVWGAVSAFGLYRSFTRRTSQDARQDELDEGLQPAGAGEAKAHRRADG
jgi:hypothetical protein